MYNKETPAYRNLSIGGKTILTKSIKAGTKLTCTYKLKSGDVKTYPVECVNSNKSVVKVESCKNGNLTISALKKGTAVITLRSKKDHSKRVLLTINVK